jgi:hypothetical protein
MTALDSWENFYIIVGSSAGALIGLQFVVITLVADMPMEGSAPLATSAFTTPSVIHFGVVLLLSAIASAPWNGMGVVAVLWSLIGLGGMIYTVIVARRMRAQTVYKPVFEDWAFHALLPIAAYVTLVVSACLDPSYERPALFLVAAAALLLLFIGIHNAWDIATYHLFSQRRKQRDTEPPAETKE